MQSRGRAKRPASEGQRRARGACPAEEAGGSGDGSLPEPRAPAAALSPTPGGRHPAPAHTAGLLGPLGSLRPSCQAKIFSLTTDGGQVCWGNKAKNTKGW